MAFTSIEENRRQQLIKQQKALIEKQKQDKLKKEKRQIRFKEYVRLSAWFVFINIIMAIIFFAFIYGSSYFIYK